jgi:hypothetical protein
MPRVLQTSSTPHDYQPPLRHRLYVHHARSHWCKPPKSPRTATFPVSTGPSSSTRGCVMPIKNSTLLWHRMCEALLLVMAQLLLAAATCSSRRRTSCAGTSSIMSRARSVPSSTLVHFFCSCLLGAKKAGVGTLPTARVLHMEPPASEVSLSPERVRQRSEVQAGSVCRREQASLPADTTRPIMFLDPTPNNSRASRPRTRELRGEGTPLLSIDSFPLLALSCQLDLMLTHSCFQRMEDWHTVRCICGSIAGRRRESTGGDGVVTTTFRLAKYSIRPMSSTMQYGSYALSSTFFADALYDSIETIPLSTFVVADMLELQQAHASYRFIIFDEEEERPRILVKSLVLRDHGRYSCQIYRSGFLSHIYGWPTPRQRNIRFPNRGWYHARRFSSRSSVHPFQHRNCPRMSRSGEA